MYIDLHTHSHYSDGTYSPSELVNEARALNLKAIALTDHDTIDGIDEFLQAGFKNKIETIPGIELSAEYSDKDIHILGLFIDPKNTTLNKTLIKIKEDRNNRNIKMIKKLNALNYPISLEELLETSKGDVITRAHFAKLLLQKKYVKSAKEAFHHIIGSDCPGYVKREILSPEAAIQLIIEAQGIPVLAHPLLYNFEEGKLITLIEELITYGLQGLECIYTEFTYSQTQFLIKLAEKYNLKVTGGSDFHGMNKKNTNLGVGKGNLKISYDLLTKLKRQE